MKNAKKILQVGNLNRSNGGKQPYQQDMVYDPQGGLLPALSAELNGLLILIYEEIATDNQQEQ